MALLPFGGEVVRERRWRLAAGGYLGHKIELYRYGWGRHPVLTLGQTYRCAVPDTPVPRGGICRLHKTGSAILWARAQEAPRRPSD